VRGAARQPGAAPASAADRACQQQRQALSYRQRPHPLVESGRPRSGHGTLLCPASFPCSPDSLATNGLIGINSMLQISSAPHSGRHSAARNMAGLGSRVPSTHRKEPIDRSKRSFVTPCQSVPHQVRDCNHHEVVHLAEPDEVSHACHGATVVDHLADHASGVESRETSKIDRGLRLAPAF
jgi:hypothetical protein